MLDGGGNIFYKNYMLDGGGNIFYKNYMLGGVGNIFYKNYMLQTASATYFTRIICYRRRRQHENSLLYSPNTMIGVIFAITYTLTYQWNLAHRNCPQGSYQKSEKYVIFFSRKKAIPQ